MSNFSMSAVCRILTRGVLCGTSSCLSVTGFRDFSSGVSRLDSAGTDSVRAASAINLTYDVYDGKGDSTPLVFLHGLFGSKSNFHSIAKSLVERTDRKVLTVDARNHGKSPHSPVLTYEAMTYDLTHLLEQLHIGKCVLIGHSMGGKVAMTTALSQPDLVEGLVVVDISPSQTSARTNFHAYIQAMKEVKIASNIPRSTARRLAEDQLRKIVRGLESEPCIVPMEAFQSHQISTRISSFVFRRSTEVLRVSNDMRERSVRQFLLTNLEEQNGAYGWRINLEAISNHLEDLMGFPGFNTTYEGPTLFLGGSSSAYISSDDYPEIQRLFPSADIQYIPDASHWIHADKPLDFISSIITFLQS